MDILRCSIIKRIAFIKYIKYLHVLNLSEIRVRTLLKINCRK